jgi:hypothetical protein
MSNKRSERSRHERASLLSRVGEPLKRINVRCLNMSAAKTDSAEPIQTPKKRGFRDVLKWGALAAAAMNPIVNHYHASYYLVTHSTPRPYPPEPFLSKYGGGVLLLTLILGLASLPRWQGIVALAVLPVCLLLWGYGL